MAKLCKTYHMSPSRITSWVLHRNDPTTTPIYDIVNAAVEHTIHLVESKDLEMERRNRTKHINKIGTLGKRKRLKKGNIRMVDLIDDVFYQAKDIPRGAVDKIVKATFNQIALDLKNGNNVFVKGFGKFSVNITKKKLTIGGKVLLNSKRPKFTPSTVLKKTIMPKQTYMSKEEAESNNPFELK